MTRKSVSILIAAYNEENNINLLLSEILNQKQNGFVIKQIIVSSDGSTDNTILSAKKVKSKTVEVLENRSRKGKNYRLNELLMKSTSDINVVLDADIKIADEYFIRKLVYPIINGYDLTSSGVNYLKPRNNFEKVLSVSIDVINNSLVFKNNRGGVYSCRGIARAFSTKLSSKIRFPMIVGDDAYSYFYCKKEGFRYKYVADAKPFIRLPSNMQDHIRQSMRFSHSSEEMKKIFGSVIVADEYAALSSRVYVEIIKRMFKDPLYTVMYLMLYLYTKLRSTINNGSKSDKWEIAISSKILEG